MDKKFSEFNGLYYVFEYDFDASTLFKKREYISLCDIVTVNGNRILSDTYLPNEFGSYFLSSYTYLATKFGDVDLNYREILHPLIQKLLDNACNEDNLEKTKIDYENIKTFLQDKNLYNQISLDYLCRFMNRTMPVREYDILNDLTFFANSNKKLYSSYNHLKKNIKTYNKEMITIEADSIFEDAFNNKISQIIYKIQTPMDLFLVTLYILYGISGIMKICQNCKLPFILYKTDNKHRVYCYRNNELCKKEGRKTKERERYKGTQNRLFKNISGKFEYRKTYYDEEWKNVYYDFLAMYYELKKQKTDDEVFEWLKSVDNKLKEFMETPFQISDIT